MGKKVKILILIGITISLLSCEVAKKLIDKDKEDDSVVLTTNSKEEDKIEEDDQVIEEVEEEIKPIDLQSNINIDYSYEVIGDKNICSDILFINKYTN